MSAVRVRCPAAVRVRAVCVSLGILTGLLGIGAWSDTASAQPARPTPGVDSDPARPTSDPAPATSDPAPATPGVDSDPARAPDPSARSVVRVTTLDGTYLALGPTAALVRVDGQWDGGFGGEISLVRVRERERLAALGLAAGALRLAADDRGRAWSEVLAGTRLAGIHVGLGAGADVEIDAVRPPRWGGHATVWIFAGVVPYARAGVVEGGGRFAEIGIKIAFPVVDW